MVFPQISSCSISRNPRRNYKIAKLQTLQKIIQITKIAEIAGSELSTCKVSHFLNNYCHQHDIDIQLTFFRLCAQISFAQIFAKITTK